MLRCKIVRQPLSKHHHDDDDDDDDDDENVDSFFLRQW